MHRLAKPNRSSIESVLMTAFLGQSLFLFTGRCLLTAGAMATAVSAATHARAVHPDKKYDEQDPKPVSLQKISHDVTPFVQDLDLLASFGTLYCDLEPRILVRIETMLGSYARDMPMGGDHNRLLFPMG